MAICAIGLIWLQEVAETLKKVKLKRSEPLHSLLEVVIRFYLAHVLIAIIAFLWDVLMQPFWPDPFLIFSEEGLGTRLELVLECHKSVLCKVKVRLCAYTWNVPNSECLGKLNSMRLLANMYL